MADCLGFNALGRGFLLRAEAGHCQCSFWGEAIALSQNELQTILHAAAPVCAGVAKLEVVLMHNAFVSIFLSKGRNFIKPMGRTTLERLLLPLLPLPCWHVALGSCSFRSQKPVCALTGWCGCLGCPTAGSALSLALEGLCLSGHGHLAVASIL